MDLKGKKVLVFGAGKSGIGAADLLGSVGAQPIIYDGNENLDKEAVLHKTNGTYTPEIWAGALQEKARFLQLQEPTARQQQQLSLERLWEMPVNLYLL